MMPTLSIYEGFYVCAPDDDHNRKVWLAVFVCVMNFADLLFEFLSGRLQLHWCSEPLKQNRHEILKRDFYIRNGLKMSLFVVLSRWEPVE